MTTNKPLVSVVMLAYNHEKFIAQAIESVLMQQVNFTYELIIGEDLSKDKTLQIALDYKTKYPEIITVLEDKVNLGMALNARRVTECAQGKYIATLEGDDFWTDKNKLQTQVDFMEANAGFSVCFHNANVLPEYDSSIQPYLQNNLSKDVFTINDVVGTWFMATCTLLFRRDFIIPLPAWFNNVASGDIVYIVLLAAKGHIKFIDKVMATYRLHSAGISFLHVGKKRLTDRVAMYHLLDEELNLKYHSLFKKAILTQYRIRLNELKQAKDEYNMGEKVSVFLNILKYQSPETPKDFVVYWTLKLMPGLYRFYSSLKKKAE